jgi:spermidine/putrescine transport system substrate-binding protein
MTGTISRRGFNLCLGSGLTSALVAGYSRRAHAAETITVLNWQGYGSDEPWALKLFAEQTGITVRHDYFNSEPEMQTKLRTNPGAYDVVLINSARTRSIAEEGLIDPIALDALPNAKDLVPSLRDHANLTQGATHFGVSWLWGMNSLAVRQGKVIGADSFAVLSDPAWRDRAALFDDAVTEIGVGALLTGQDINAPKDLDAIAASLKAMKPNVKLVWSSESEFDKAFAAGAFDVAIYWSGAAARAQTRYHLPIEFIVPKEGAIGWLDGLSIPATAKHKAAGLKFINFMIDPRFYVQWAESAGAAASANGAAMAQLPADNAIRTIHKPEYLDKLQFMSMLPDDRRQAFVDLWSEVKAFYAT